MLFANRTSMPSSRFPWLPPVRSTPTKLRTTMRSFEFASARPLSPFPTTLSATIAPSALLTPTDPGERTPERRGAVLADADAVEANLRIVRHACDAVNVDAGLGAEDDVPVGSGVATDQRMQRTVYRRDPDLVRERDVAARVGANEIRGDDVVMGARRPVDQDAVRPVPGDQVAGAGAADQVPTPGDDDPLIVRITSSSPSAVVPM